MNINLPFKKLRENSTKFTTKYTSARLCPICDKRKHEKLEILRKFQFFTDSRLPKKINFQTVRCKLCQIIYQNPAYNKKGLNILFKEAGMSYGTTLKSKKNQISWLKKNNLLKKNIKVLDVGCFDGSFLSLMPKYVIKFGVEIDKSVIEGAKKKFKKISFINGNFENFRTKEKFNLITMMHVLEHLLNPEKVLKNLFKISKKKTILVIEVPIIENHMSNSLDGFITTQHMTHFSKNSLNNLLAKCGWKILRSKTIKNYNGYRVTCEKSSEINKKINVNVNRERQLYKKYKKKHLLSLRSINKRISKFKVGPKTILCGGGQHLELFYLLTKFFKLSSHSTFVIIDSDIKKTGKSWRGIKILNFETLKNIRNLNKYKFIISSYAYQNEILRNLKDLKIHSSNILKIYKKIKRY